MSYVSYVQFRGNKLVSFLSQLERDTPPSEHWYGDQVGRLTLPRKLKPGKGRYYVEDGEVHETTKVQLTAPQRVLVAAEWQVLAVGPDVKIMVGPYEGHTPETVTWANAARVPVTLHPDEYKYTAEDIVVRVEDPV